MAVARPIPKSWRTWSPLSAKEAKTVIMMAAAAVITRLVLTSP
jgi:hypothetical protein